MNKVLLVIVLVVAVGGVGAWYFWARPAEDAVDVSDETTEEVVLQEDETFTDTLKNIVGLGRSLRCTWEVEDASGTTWVKDEQTYTEVSAAGRQGNIIVKDSCVWAWTEGEEQGIKLCYETTEDVYTEGGEDAESEDFSQVSSFSLPTDVEYNCRPATVSADRFNPPSNIEFMDMQDLTPSSLEGLQ